MTEEIHITFGTDDNRVVEAECEVTAIREGKSWSFEGFVFEEVMITDCGTKESSDYDEMPSELVDQAEGIAEEEFLKLDL